jgi:TatD DNase family protein
MLIDTHCHIASDEFVDDLPDVVARAQAAGVLDAICILDAIAPDELERVATVRAAWPAVRFVAGVHPHHAGKVALDELDRVVVAALERSSAIALGEIGLDYHYDFAPRAVQRDVFGRQVAMAVARDLPVVIHTREADADTLEVLDAAGAGLARGVFHCFTGEQALADAAVARGFYVSFSGIVTFPRAEALRAVAASIPPDRWLVETDSPFLSPAPQRGGRNEPARVVHVLETMAAVRGLRANEAIEQARANAAAAFGGTVPNR